jgi:hypothetical protein
MTSISASSSASISTEVMLEAYKIVCQGRDWRSKEVAVSGITVLRQVFEAFF